MSIRDVLWLCPRANPTREEAETVIKLMKELAEGAPRHLVFKNKLLVATFTEQCRKLEEAQ